MDEWLVSNPSTSQNLVIHLTESWGFGFARVEDHFAYFLSGDWVPWDIIWVFVG
jgi:hypothetical protein